MAKNARNTAAASSNEASAEAFEFTLEEGIALPEGRTNGKQSKYPWEKMEANQSFFVPSAKAGTFYTLCNSAKKKYAPKEFKSKPWTQEGVEGVRVWRTK